MSKCSSCGAEIVWVKTEAGRSMPCDPTVLSQAEAQALADESGKRVIIVTESGGVVHFWRGRTVLPVASKDGGRISHWATCPSATQHRKGG